MITKEESENIKQQLLEHIDSTFPADKREQAKEQVRKMNESQLEEFLVKNGLIKQEEKQEKETPQCIFCTIVSGKIPSYKIDENKEVVAVLEINPVSEGHTIIIPKKHITDSTNLPKSAFSLAKAVAKKIKSKLKPLKTTIVSSNAFGHEIVNVIPVYSNENIGSERKKASQEQLIKLQVMLEKKKKAKKEKKVKEIKKENSEKQEKKIIPWFPNRIP